MIHKICTDNDHQRRQPYGLQQTGRSSASQTSLHPAGHIAEKLRR